MPTPYENENMIAAFNKEKLFSTLMEIGGLDKVFHSRLSIALMLL